MSIVKFLTFLFALISLLFEGFFGIVQFVWFVLQVLIIAWTFYFFIWIFRKKTIWIWYKTVLSYCSVILAVFWFFTSIFLIFIEYQYFEPGVVSDITLSNSWQEVVFIQMSHIATPMFFLEKRATIASLAQSGYTLLVEWVKPGNPENQSLFNQSMGFNFTPTLYAEIASFIWLQSQDNKMLFEWINTGSVVNVDLSIDEIVGLMGTWTLTKSWTLLDIGSEIQSFIDRINPRERMFAGWVARGMLNWSLKQSGNTDLLLDDSFHPNFFATIIDRRNDKILDYIQNHPKERIAIIYWALHFNGIYESLQKIDPKWKSTYTRTSKPYSK